MLRQYKAQERGYVFTYKRKKNNSQGFIKLINVNHRFVEANIVVIMRTSCWEYFLKNQNSLCRTCPNGTDFMNYVANYSSLFTWHGGFQMQISQVEQKNVACSKTCH